MDATEFLWAFIGVLVTIIGILGGLLFKKFVADKEPISREVAEQTPHERPRLRSGDMEIEFWERRMRHMERNLMQGVGAIGGILREMNRRLESIQYAERNTSRKISKLSKQRTEEQPEQRLEPWEVDDDNGNGT